MYIHTYGIYTTISNTYCYTIISNILHAAVIHYNIKHILHAAVIHYSNVLHAVIVCFSLSLFKLHQSMYQPLRRNALNVSLPLFQNCYFNSLSIILSHSHISHWTKAIQLEFFRKNHLFHFTHTLTTHTPSLHTHSNIMRSSFRCHFLFSASRGTNFKAIEEMAESAFNIQVPIELL